MKKCQLVVRCSMMIMISSAIYKYRYSFLRNHSDNFDFCNIKINIVCLLRDKFVLTKYLSFNSETLNQRYVYNKVYETVLNTERKLGFKL